MLQSCRKIVTYTSVTCLVIVMGAHCWYHSVDPVGLRLIWNCERFEPMPEA